MRTAKSCGPDTPTLVSSFRGVVRVSDGGKKARSPGRARRKPLKPLRGECRATRRDRGDLLACFLLLHARLRALRAPGIPCSPLGVALRPLFFRANGFLDNSDASRREKAEACLVFPSLRGAKRRSNPFFLCAANWIASRSLSSGAHSRDPLARNDGLLFVFPAFLMGT